MTSLGISVYVLCIVLYSPWPYSSVLTNISFASQKPSLTLHSPLAMSFLLQRTVFSKSTQIHNSIRRYSQLQALVQDSDPDLTYLDGFPRPDPKYDETILAIPRSNSGTSISSKERKAGRVPSILFEQEDGQHGGNKRLISVQTNQIRKLVNHLGRSFFLSRVFDLEVRSPAFESDDVVEKVRVLPRLVCVCVFVSENLHILQVL